jgi:hypothetical protein
MTTHGLAFFYSRGGPSLPVCYCGERFESTEMLKVHIDGALEREQAQQHGAKEVEEWVLRTSCARIEEAFRTIVPPYMLSRDEDVLMPGRATITVNEALSDVWKYAMNLALEAVDGVRR